MKALFLVSLTALVLVGCGKKEDFKYNLTENGCSTGDQQAESKDAICSRLKDSEANHSCAYSLRKQKYEQDGCGTWGS